MSCLKEVTFLPDYENGQGGGPSSANLKSLAFLLLTLFFLESRRRFSLSLLEGGMRAISTHWASLKSVVGSEISTLCIFLFCGISSEGL